MKITVILCGRKYYVSRYVQKFSFVEKREGESEREREKITYEKNIFAQKYISCNCVRVCSEID